MTLLDSILKWERTRPEEIAFFDYDKQRSWTWTEFSRVTESIHSQLGQRNPVPAIFLWARHDILFPAALVACWKQGCYPILVSEDLPLAELRELVSETGAEGSLALICTSQESEIEKLETRARSVGLIPIVLADDNDSAVRTPNPSELVADGTPALALMTSGTTRRPKVLVFSHKELFESARIEIDNGTAPVVTANLRPPFTSGGVNTLWPSFALGSINVLSEKTRLAPIARFVFDFITQTRRQFPLDLLVLSPTYLEAFVASCEADAKSLESPLRIFFGGMALRSTTAEKLIQLGFQPEMRYGMTEIGHCISRVEAKTTSAESRTGAVGKPYQGFELSIREGRLAVRSPGVASHQLKNGRLERSYDGTFLTDDKGSIDPDGEILLVGREHDFIVVRGFRFHRRDVEETFLASKLTSDIRAVPYQNDQGVQVAAIIKGVKAQDLEDRLRVYAQESLSAFKRPRVYVWIEEWPTAPNGKLDLEKLEALAKAEDQRVAGR